MADRVDPDSSGVPAESYRPPFMGRQPPRWSRRAPLFGAYSPHSTSRDVLCDACPHGDNVANTSPAGLCWTAGSHRHHFDDTPVASRTAAITNTLVLSTPRYGTISGTSHHVISTASRVLGSGRDRCQNNRRAAFVLQTPKLVPKHPSWHRRRRKTLVPSAF